MTCQRISTCSDYHHDYENGEEYDSGYTDYGSYSRGHSSRGSYSSRGRFVERNSIPPRHRRTDDQQKGLQIDQWNGPPDSGDKRGGRAGTGRTRGGASAPPTYSRGRVSSSRGGSTRGSSARGSRAKPSVPPSVAGMTVSKKRQDSTATDTNDGQEEWETASESSDHLKETSTSASRGTANQKAASPVDSGGAQTNGNHRAAPNRGSYRLSSERGRGRGASSRSSQRGAQRSANGRDSRHKKESSSPDPKGRTRARPTANGKPQNAAGGDIYRVEAGQLENPSAAMCK